MSKEKKQEKKPDKVKSQKKHRLDRKDLEKAVGGVALSIFGNDPPHKPL